jgi:hypothetical protein
MNQQQFKVFFRNIKWPAILRPLLERHGQQVVWDADAAGLRTE